MNVSLSGKLTIKYQDINIAFRQFSDVHKGGGSQLLKNAR